MISGSGAFITIFWQISWSNGNRPEVSFGFKSSVGSRAEGIFCLMPTKSNLQPLLLFLIGNSLSQAPSERIRPLFLTRELPSRDNHTEMTSSWGL